MMDGGLGQPLAGPLMAALIAQAEGVPSVSAEPWATPTSPQPAGMIRAFQPQTLVQPRFTPRWAGTYPYAPQFPQRLTPLGLIDQEFQSFRDDTQAAIDAFEATVIGSSAQDLVSSPLIQPHAIDSGILVVADGPAFGIPTPESPLIVTANGTTTFQVTGRVGNTLLGVQAINPLTGTSTPQNPNLTISTSLAGQFNPTDATLVLSDGSAFDTPTIDAPLQLVAEAPDGSEVILRATGRVGDTLTGIEIFNPTTGTFGRTADGQFATSSFLTSSYQPGSGVLSVADGGSFGQPTTANPLLVSAVFDDPANPSSTISSNFQATGRAGNNLLGVQAFNSETGGFGGTITQTQTVSSTLVGVYTPGDNLFNLADGDAFVVPAGGLTVLVTEPDGQTFRYTATGRVGNTLTGIQAIDLPDRPLNAGSTVTAEVTTTETVTGPALPIGTTIEAQVSIPTLPVGTTIRATTLDVPLPIGTVIQAEVPSPLATNGADILNGFFVTRTDRLARQLGDQLSRFNFLAPRAVRTGFALRTFLFEALAGTEPTSLASNLLSIAEPNGNSAAFELFRSAIDDAIESARIVAIEGTRALALGIDIVSPPTEALPTVPPPFVITPLPSDGGGTVVDGGDDAGGDDAGDAGLI